MWMQSPNWSKILSHLLRRFISTSRCYISMLYNCFNPNEWFSFWMSYILVPCVSVASRLYRTDDMLSLSIRSVAVFLLCFASFIIGICCLFFFTKTVLVFYSMSLLNCSFFYHFVYCGWGSYFAYSFYLIRWPFLYVDYYDSNYLGLS